jgi:hypothetical protein
MSRCKTGWRIYFDREAPPLGRPLDRHTRARAHVALAPSAIDALPIAQRLARHGEVSAFPCGSAMKVMAEVAI